MTKAPALELRHKGNLLAVKLIHERLVRIHLARSLSGKTVQLNAGHRYFAAGGANPVVEERAAGAAGFAL